MNQKSKEHWETVYDTIDTEDLMWHEEKPGPCLDLILKYQINLIEPILIIGAGSTTLIDTLLEKGYTNIIATDISENAFIKLKERLGNQANKVQWIVDDLTKPKEINQLKDIAFWHDRAVLHFFLDDQDKKSYKDTLNKVLKTGGHAAISTFSLKGATYCSGLKVNQYDENTLQDFLGKDFELLESFDYLYHTPTGLPKPYIYTLFKKL